MTRQELMNRYQQHIETLRQELWYDSDDGWFSIHNALQKIIRERNEMLKAYGFKVSRTDRLISFEAATNQSENRYAI